MSTSMTVAPRAPVSVAGARPLGVVAVLSLLHEGRVHNSATRTFRNRPVLRWTIERLGQAGSARDTDIPIAVVFWSDQRGAVDAALKDTAFVPIDAGPRLAHARIDAITAAQRWADGWRGGLLGTCWFDRGFHGGSVARAVEATFAEAALIVDPSSGLTDPGLIESLLAHAQAHPDREIVFHATAPGLSGVLLRKPLVLELARLGSHPGKALHYNPDHYAHDPIATPACVPAPAPLCRTLHRLTLGCTSQIAHIEALTAHLNGQLLSTPAETLIGLVDHAKAISPLPRDLRLELTTRRATQPLFRPPASSRSDRPLSAWLAVLDELASPSGETSATRITLAGPGGGDPLLYSDIMPFLAACAARDIPVCLETDFVSIPPETIDALAGSSADVVLVHLPAATAHTYAVVMGVPLHNEVLANLTRFLRARGTRSTPILVPCFTKCRENLAEMEPWYDHYLKHLGAAVIEGATDFAGQIAAHAVADMSPPQRVPCRRLGSRMQLLSDGNRATCEFDLSGVTAGTVAEAWRQLDPLRALHTNILIEKKAVLSLPQLCSTCREWHRP